MTKMLPPKTVNKILKKQDNMAQGPETPLKVPNAGSTIGARRGQYGLPKSGKRSVVRM